MLNINIDLILLVVGVTTALILLLGFTIYFNARSSTTNRTFLVFSLLAALYGLFNYLLTQVDTEAKVLLLLRLSIFAATFYSLLLFQFAYVFPKQTAVYSWKYRYILVPIVTIVAALNLSPFVFSGIESVADRGQASLAIVEPGIYLFVALIIFLVMGSFYQLFKKMNASSGQARYPTRLVFAGTVFTYTLILIFVLILPAVFKEVRFLPYASVFTIPFIVLTSYAIVRHSLLNVRVVAPQLLTFGIWLFVIVRIFLSNDAQERMLNVVLLIALIPLGILLMHSTTRAIQARKKSEHLASELELANKELKRIDKARGEFISVASHQLKTPLWIIKNNMSLIQQGELGKIGDEVRGVVNGVYFSAERLMNLVSDLLDLSRMQTGKLHYEFTEFDIGGLLDSVIQEFLIPISEKDLRINWKRPSQDVIVSGDSRKLRQVLFNLVDNALKYTRQGTITVTISSNDQVVIKIIDTGAGMAAHTIRNLFQMYARGDNDAQRMNRAGTGLGLFIASKIVGDHEGTLHASSPGVGRGSTFVLTLASAKM